MTDWPPADDVDGWAQLANMALQLESLQVDLEESARWKATMARLVSRQLPYAAYTEARMAALRDRLRLRKLAQANLRYKYGFRGRSRRLVRRDVRVFLEAD